MIIDASTILILRDATPTFEVFMVKRHSKSSFMANAWVYPGGRLDPDDTTDAALSRIVDITPQNAAERLGLDSPNRAAGLYLAGIRETFEEAGVLLARRSGSDAWLRLVDDETSVAFADYREQLQNYELSLSDLAAKEDLVFPCDELAFFSHWITPTFESKRFDTFFFLARAPVDQEPLHDAREVTAGEWVTPAAALDKFRAGDAYLAPPTIRTLERLAAFDSIDTAFASTVGNLPAVILPHLDTSGERPTLLLPGDPDYPDLEEYALATPVTDGPTRMPLVLPS